jgi:hypothetical protein
VEQVSTEVKRLADLVRCFDQAFDGDAQFFEALERDREQQAERYAAEVNASQLRPVAANAFRQGQYARAADLYAQMIDQLTPAETKKLALARKLSGS